MTAAPPCLNKGNVPPLKSSPFLPWPELYLTDGNSVVVRWLVRTPCFHAEGASEGLGFIPGGILENLRSYKLRCGAKKKGRGADYESLKGPGLVI